jgi:hypothetical protein
MCGQGLRKAIPFCWFLMFIFVLSKERIRGASRLAKGRGIVVGVIVRAAILRRLLKRIAPVEDLAVKARMISFRY